MNSLKQAMILLTLLAVCLPPICHADNKARLDVIVERGILRVGTTDDYSPFCTINPETGEHQGYDIDAVRTLGTAMGVKLRFVKTTWATLTTGIQNGSYDIAVCGITRTLSRQLVVNLSDPYMTVGKSALIRSTDRSRFKTLADIDRPDVKIGVNPGGTNERFVRASIKQAEIVMIPNNLEIPASIESGAVDLMITDNVEARLIAHQRPALYAVSPDKPFTRGDFGYMVPRNAPQLLNWLNLWIHQMKQQGEFARLGMKWIGK